MSADEIVAVQTLLESLHNRNIYVYCDGNPVARVDNNGAVWGVIATKIFASVVGTVAGGAVSLATQVVIERKSFGELDWLEVGSSAISGAVATMGFGRGMEVIINAAIGGATSIIKKEDTGMVVWNTFSGAVSGYVGGAGAGFGRKRGGYLHRMEKYSTPDVPKEVSREIRKMVREGYVKNVKKDIKNTTISGIESYGVGKFMGKIPNSSNNSPQVIYMKDYMKEWRNGGWINIAY